MWSWVSAFSNRFFKPLFQTAFSNRFSNRFFKPLFQTTNVSPNSRRGRTVYSHNWAMEQRATQRNYLNAIMSRFDETQLIYYAIKTRYTVNNCMRDRNRYSLSMYCHASSEMSDAAVAVRPNCCSAQHSKVTHSLHKHLAWPLQFCFLRLCSICIRKGK